MPIDLGGGPIGVLRRGRGRLPLVLPVVLVAAGLSSFVLYRWAISPAAGPVAALVQSTRAADLPVHEPNLGHLAAAPGGTIVVDGDTLRLQNDVVRLDGVAAPARGDRCDGASTSDCATAAAAQLAVLVHDHSVSCRVVGHDRLGRPSARCDVGLPNAGAHDADSLNQLIVASGWARAAASDLEPAERAARASHRGLWAGDGANARRFQ